MEKVFTHTVDKGIKLMMFNLANAGKITRSLRGQVQVQTA